ncbi:MAG: glycosyltransferase family 4 protein [Patescibacteria group bacterium]
MKLLFITQKVDLDDDILGVYHSWISKLAQKFTKISVVCLYQGKTELPNNVGVFSLGKESGPSRLKYIFNFYKYIWKLRHDYDVVFVHMNPIYIVLGGLFWKLYDKKTSLWYNHPMGNVIDRVGIFFSGRVFCTSKYSFAAKFSKTNLMPAGIDVDLFKKVPVAKNHNQILFLGRISPIKKIEVLISAAELLDRQKIDFQIYIIGSPSSRADEFYKNKLKTMSLKLIKDGKIIFRSSIPNSEAVLAYNESRIFINLTPTGSLDKTTLEAMSCETMILVSNLSYKDILPSKLVNLFIFNEGDSDNLGSKIINLLKLESNEEIRLTSELRDIVVNHHSLNYLMEKLSIALAF